MFWVSRPRPGEQQGSHFAGMQGRSPLGPLPRCLTLTRKSLSDTLGPRWLRPRHGRSGPNLDGRRPLGRPVELPSAPDDFAGNADDDHVFVSIVRNADILDCLVAGRPCNLRANK